MALQWVRPGDLVLSKIDLKNGAVTTLPNWSDVAVTTHFAVYEPDLGRVDPRYVERLMQTSHFREWLWASRSGADGRTEVKLDTFEALPIPLPSLEEQRALVAAYDSAIAKAETDDAAAVAEERAATAGFAAALGLAAPPPLPDRPIFVARFADLDRWGHEAALRRTTSAPPAASPWPMVRLGDVIADLENGWSPKCLDRPAEPGEWGVLKVSAATSGSYCEDQNKALPTHLASKSDLEVKAGQVVIARASGAAALVGTAAYIRETRPKLMLCDKLFRIIPRPDDCVDTEFLANVLALPSVRQQVLGEFSTESGMMKNISKPALLALTFPLPPPDVQRKLVVTLGAAKKRASDLRKSAAATRAAALEAFEDALYASDVS